MKYETGGNMTGYWECKKCGAVCSTGKTHLFDNSDCFLCSEQKVKDMLQISKEEYYSEVCVNRKKDGLSHITIEQLFDYEG
jgi:hypothetical protein